MLVFEICTFSVGGFKFDKHLCLIPRLAGGGGVWFKFDKDVFFQYVSSGLKRNYLIISYSLYIWEATFLVVVHVLFYFVGTLDLRSEGSIKIPQVQIHQVSYIFKPPQGPCSNGYTFSNFAMEPEHDSVVVSTVVYL